jgi:hypothetical protein
VMIFLIFERLGRMHEKQNIFFGFINFFAIFFDKNQIF